VRLSPRTFLRSVASARRQKFELLERQRDLAAAGPGPALHVIDEQIAARLGG
jgi:hypothetical protein